MAESRVVDGQISGAFLFPMVGHGRGSAIRTREHFFGLQDLSGGCQILLRERRCSHPGEGAGK